MTTIRHILAVAALALFASFAAPGSVPAGDDIGAAASLWKDFVAAIRRGDYPAAHAMFSAQSRDALPYGEFVREYGPLSVAREMVVAKPDSLSTRLDDDWAEISYSGHHPDSGKGFRVGVALVRNEGVWGLVAARNERAERVEAEARAILAVAAAWKGNPDAGRFLREFLASDRSGINPAAHYRFETDGRNFAAVPTTGGLRTFRVDEWGMVRSGKVAAAPTSATQRPVPVRRAPQPASRPNPPRLVDGLPELAEPPAPDIGEMPFGEIAEPPAAPFPARGRATTAGAPEPERFELPDTIR